MNETVEALITPPLLLMGSSSLLRDDQFFTKVG